MWNKIGLATITAAFIAGSSVIALAQGSGSGAGTAVSVANTGPRAVTRYNGPAPHVYGASPFYSQGKGVVPNNIGGTAYSSASPGYYGSTTGAPGSEGFGSLGTSRMGYTGFGPGMVGPANGPYSVGATATMGNNTGYGQTGTAGNGTLGPAQYGTVVPGQR